MLLRITLKVFLFPIRLAISIFTGAMKFIIDSAIINKILYIASGLLLIGFFALAWSAIFVSHDMPLTVRILMPSLALIASYIVSPTSGALKYFRFFIERIEGFNNLLKKI